VYASPPKAVADLGPSSGSETQRACDAQSVRNAWVLGNGEILENITRGTSWVLGGHHRVSGGDVYRRDDRNRERDKLDSQEERGKRRSTAWFQKKVSLLDFKGPGGESAKGAGSDQL